MKTLRRPNWTFAIFVATLTLLAGIVVMVGLEGSRALVEREEARTPLPTPLHE
ncbi:MAG: hypothetical protein AAF517_02140 [Planctomycetota bacterium]